MMLRAVLLYALPLALGQFTDASGGRYANMTIWQALRNMARSSDPNGQAAIGLAHILQQPCGQEVRRMLDNPSRSFTLFAPPNEAFNAAIGEESIPLRQFNCGRGKCSRAALQASRMTLGQVNNCLGEILRLHVVPGVQFVVLYNAQGHNLVNVLPTLLNSTELVRMSIPQQLVVNQTSTNIGHTAENATFVTSNAGPPARVIIAAQNVQCLNGVIHGIDRMLLPAYDAFVSLKTALPQPASLAIRTPASIQRILQMSNITMFWPVGGQQSVNETGAVLQSVSQLLNFTDYILPQRVLYNNLTEGNVSLPALNNQTALNITFNQNFNMTVNGVLVVRANIPIENGVLHLLERPILP